MDRKRREVHLFFFPFRSGVTDSHSLPEELVVCRPFFVLREENSLSGERGERGERKQRKKAQKRHVIFFPTLWEKERVRVRTSSPFPHATPPLIPFPFVRSPPPSAVIALSAILFSPSAAAGRRAGNERKKEKEGSLRRNIWSRFHSLCVGAVGSERETIFDNFSSHCSLQRTSLSPRERSSSARSPGSASQASNVSDNRRPSSPTSAASASAAAATPGSNGPSDAKKMKKEEVRTLRSFRT